MDARARDCKLRHLRPLRSRCRAGEGADDTECAQEAFHTSDLRTPLRFGKNKWAFRPMDTSPPLRLSPRRPVRHAFRLVLAFGFAFLIAAAAPREVESTHLKIIVGVTDDTAKWMVHQDGIVGVHRDLRLMAVRVTIPWRGQAKPTRLQRVYMQRIRR